MTDIDDVNRMTDDERLDELADTLANGLLRLYGRAPGRTKKRAFSSHNSLDVPADKSVHVTNNQQEG